MSVERKFEMAGRALRLRYTVNALCAVEERAGMSLDALMERPLSGARLLLWGGIAACQPEVSPEDVGEWMDVQLRAGGRIEDIVKICADALAEAGFLEAAEG